MSTLPECTAGKSPAQVSMSVSLKCAACGAEVEFESLSSTVEATCPGCDVKVRYREGDERMAIPVSMSLPEEFQPVDLDLVADKSSLLVGRYRKVSEEAPTSVGAQRDEVLAKALESLAHSIGHLEERLSRHEQNSATHAPAHTPGESEDAAAAQEIEADETSGNGHANPVTVVEGNGEAGADVVQLDPQSPAGEKFRGRSKANPLGAQVLVRREAAKVAHDFRRERHTQSDWDEHAAEHEERRVGFKWLMDHFPKTTVLVSLVLVSCLIATTFIWMDAMFTTKDEAGPKNEQVRTTTLGELMKDDPEAALAEIVARGFLNATSVETAAPFIYESDVIREKLEKYYKPISRPGEYELSFKHRAKAADGKMQFLYRVAMPGEKDRMLVILPEGKMPKVFWEFFSEVGDISWDSFMKDQPREEVEMRVWVYPGEEYVEGYNEEHWVNYILHDFAEDRRVLAYADRGASEDWHIKDALENEPVKFKRHSAVMALVKLKFMVELPATAEDPGVTVAQIKDVVSTSWLPERFRKRK